MSGRSEALPKLAWAGLGALCIASATIIVVLGTRLTFFNDDWYVLLLRRGVSAETILEPHNGHLTAIPILTYKALVAGFGLDAQLPFRIVLASVIVALGVVVFIYVRDRCGDLLGLLAAALVLLLGSAWQDLLWSFQIGLVGSLPTGIGALLALERRTKRGDLSACLLLIASIALSNLGTSFILAAAVLVLMRTPRRLPDLWVPAVPSLLFAAWWLAYGHGDNTGFSWTNVARTPVYVLDAISAGLASLTGLNQAVGGGVDAYSYGRPLLALAFIGTLYWLHRGGRPSPGALPLVVAAMSFWVLLGIDFIPNWREPDTSRYQLVSVTFLILIAAELFRPVRLSRGVLVLVVAATLISIGSNLDTLKGGYDFFRNQSEIARADLGALDIGRDHIDRKFRLLQPIAGSIYMTGIFAGPYYRERDAHGSPAYSPSELAAASAGPRSAADVVLASGYGLHLSPLTKRPAGTARAGCRELRPGSGEVPRELDLHPGLAEITNQSGLLAHLQMRRFADSELPVDLGNLAPGAKASLMVPADSAPSPWHLAETAGSALRVCALRPTPQG